MDSLTCTHCNKIYKKAIWLTKHIESCPKRPVISVTTQVVSSGSDEILDSTFVSEISHNIIDGTPSAIEDSDFEDESPEMQIDVEIVSHDVDPEIRSQIV